MGKQITAEQYQRKLAANIKTMQFMQSLLPHYSAAEMHRLWESLGVMTRRYGIAFVADCIDKSKAETELALLRDGRRQ